MENTTIGFENDEIFLLSAEEYEHYKDIVPLFKTWWWWLRSPGIYPRIAAVVLCGGSVSYHCNFVLDDDTAVRPALKISEQESENLEIGERFTKYDFQWVYLGDNISIAEVPVAFYRFNEASNDYGKSEVRQFLLNWLKVRKDEGN